MPPVDFFAARDRPASAQRPFAMPWRQPRRRIDAWPSLLLLALCAACCAAHAETIDIVGPPGSSAFGSRVSVLPNGNIVVVDPGGPVAGIGAVHLYGPDGGAPISTITGVAAGDQIGSGGIVVLANGNFLILSPGWHNGGAANAGAVTWADRDLGVSGLVSPQNSLVGSSANDLVGNGAALVTALANGHYVVRAPRWDDGAVQDVGAVTWGNGTTGVAGAIGVGNSLIGGHANAEVGSGGVVVVGTSHYVVSSPLWDNGGTAKVGAATWGNGATGITGLVSVANSLVGSSANDNVGTVTALANGNYVVATSRWDNGGTADVGAVTWASGSSGLVGVVSTANSLVGTTQGDHVGAFVTALVNGHYVVGSPDWENSATATARVGAATWCNGTAATSAAVSSASSLVGSSQNDRVASAGATALRNGNYVVQSPDWRNGGNAAGAATWRSGAASSPGVVAGTNSQVGTSGGDAVGAVVLALTNGHFVLASPLWDNGPITDAGAVTWGNGTGGNAGPLSAVNSLVGSRLGDGVGTRVIALPTGHYVSASATWDLGAIADAGAASFGNGSGGTVGVVSATNSLVGSTALDGVGQSLLALSNGDYLVASPGWSDGARAAIGAITWAPGSSGISGAVAAGNSMLGTASNDRIGNAGMIALPDGKALLLSSLYDNGAIADAGAVSLLDGAGALPAALDPAHSVLGTVAASGAGMASAQTVAYDPPRGQVVVGRPASNRVTLLRVVDAVFADGFE